MKKLVFGLIILSAVTLSGCGVIVGMRADAALFNMQTVQENMEIRPIKSPVYKQVRSVVVADLSGRMGPEFPADNVRLYKAAVKELELMLKESGRFKVISGADFRDKLEAMDAAEDITTLTDEELDSEMAKVGKALGSHAVVSFGLEDPGVTSLANQAKYMGQMMIQGSISIDMIANLDVIRTRTSEMLWAQKSKVIWTSGTKGLKTTTNNELRQKLRAVLSPIVQQAVSDHAA